MLGQPRPQQDDEKPQGKTATAITPGHQAPPRDGELLSLGSLPSADYERMDIRLVGLGTAIISTSSERCRCVIARPSQRTVLQLGIVEHLPAAGWDRGSCAWATNGLLRPALMPGHCQS
jgi:hypothetical protein